MDVNRVRAAKNKFYMTVEKDLKYYNLLKKVKKESKKLSFGKLREKGYSRDIIKEAMEVEL